MRKLDPDSEDAPWEQIAADLRAAIADGTHPPGSPLPSITTLAQQYEVNRKTVRKAMAALAGEGLASERDGRGYFAAHGGQSGK